MNGFAGKWFLVTGSSRGIGRRIAEDLCSEKANLILHGSRESPQLSEAVSSLSDCGSSILHVVADTSTREGISTIKDFVKSRGIMLHGLVNNAGIYTISDLGNLDHDDWDQVLSIDLKSHIFLSQALREFLEPGSSIVNVASVLGMKGAKWGLSYQAAKAGLIHLTRSLALELAPEIRVNCVSPGYVKTAINEMARTNEEFVKSIEKATPLKRWGETSDVSAVVMFLLSDMASYVTGANYVVSGGLDLR